MNLIKAKCAFCGKEFFRSNGHFNEAKKFRWKQYCSKECQSKSKTTKIENFCGNPNCNNVVSRTLNQFKRSKSGLIFCSQSCAAVVNNRKNPKRKPKFKTCIRCSKQFRKSKGNLKFCSMNCFIKYKDKRKPNHNSRKLLNMIREKARELGRTPARREMENIEKLCRKIFGSWNNAIIAAGFHPNRSHSQRMYKRTNAKALDGHLCDSVSELLIDNWFAQNNIPHQKDIPYPKTNHKADWKISVGNKEIFVEYFGLANDSPRYDRTIREKIKLCQNCKIPLIEIYPKDIYPKNILDNNLKNKFRKIFNV